MRSEPTDKKTSAFSFRGYLAWLWLPLVLFFGLLEYFRPYFFLQDDALSGNLPMLVHNFRALAGGELAFFNFHQYLGVPQLASAQYATLYPPAYIAVGLSKLFFGHYFAAMDIVMFLHLLCGAYGFYFLARDLFGDERGAAFGSAVWTFSAFMFFLGSSWWVVGPTAAFLPWTVYLSARLMRGEGGFFTLSAVRLLYLSSGNVQFYAYSCIFEVLYFGVRHFAVQRYSVRRIWQYFATHGFTFLLAAPMLVPMWHQTQLSAVRSGAIDYQRFVLGSNKILLWLWGLVWPFSVPFADVASARTFGATSWLDLFMPYFAHIGYIALFFCGYALYKAGKTRRIVGLVCFGVALCWAMGWLDQLIYRLPVLNRFRYPIKITAYMNFFLALAAAFGMAEFLKGRKKAAAVFAALLGLQLVNMFGLFAFSPRRNFFIHPDKMPLSEPLYDNLSQGRIFSLGAVPEHGVNSVYRLLGFNFSSLFGVHHFAGYDPLVPQANSAAVASLNYSSIVMIPPEELPGTIKYLRSWGVRWYVINPPQADTYIPVLQAQGLKNFYSGPDRVIFEDPAARPIVYAAGADLDWHYRTNSIEADTRSAMQSVLFFAVLHNPYFKAYIDGKETPLILLPGSQMAVKVSAGVHKVALKYRDPLFFRALWAALAALAVFILFYRRGWLS